MVMRWLRNSGGSIQAKSGGGIQGCYCKLPAKRKNGKDKAVGFESLVRACFPPPPLQH